MFDVTALGEILIDFTPCEVFPRGNICFERNPGGAPANVLVAVSRLGGKTAFLGKVGKDMFGEFLRETLTSNNVDTSGLGFSDKENTTLAFVQIDEKGDRSFSFYRNPGADTTLESTEVNFNTISDSKIFHFGSLSLTCEPSKTSTLTALKYARENGCIISYDPNLRPALWKSTQHAMTEIVSVLPFVDILKISEEELEFITESNNMEQGSRKLMEEYGINLILITRGAAGSYYRYKEITGFQPAFSKVKPIDTTGAGDAFLGGFLYFILSNGIKKVEDFDKKLNEDFLAKMVKFANTVAFICTTKKGAIPAMPYLNMVKALLE
jgi:fructokinase